MKNIKINEKYLLNLDQVFSFRTFFFLILWGALLSGSIREVMRLSQIGGNILGDTILGLLFLLGFLYWLYHDFVIKVDTYKKDEPGEMKYDNYSLSEIVLDISNGNKNKSLKYKFYEKNLVYVLSHYFETVGVKIEKNVLEEEVGIALEDSYDESYKIKNLQKINNVDQVDLFLNEKAKIIQYGIFYVSQKIDKNKQLDYKGFLDGLNISWRDKKKIIKISNIVISIVKGNKDLKESYTYYVEEDDMHRMLITLITNRIIFEYYAKDKMDIFQIIGYIILPQTLVWKLFGKIFGR